MPSWLRYLGFLGLIGLLGLFTDNPGFYGFFGFFGFFGFANITHDERLEANINKATRNTFISFLLVFSLTTIYVSLTKQLIAYAWGFAIAFALQILIFTLSLQYYEKMEQN